MHFSAVHVADMKNQTQNNGPLLAEIVAHETQVWDALVAGDPEADGKMLTKDFLGVYPSGYCPKSGHCEQLENGPSMVSYELSQTRLRIISPDAVLLSYRAQYRAIGGEKDEVMYISSLWERDAEGWLNSFSQDTPAA